MAACAAQGCTNEAARYGLFEMSEPRFFLFLCVEHAVKSSGYLDSCSISRAGNYRTEMFSEKHGWCNPGFYVTEETAIADASRDRTEFWTGSRVVFDDGESMREVWREGGTP